MDTPWSDQLNWKDPKKCAKKVGLSFPDIMECYNGARGDELLQEASAEYVRQFPERVNLPATTVNGEAVDPDFDDIKKAACRAGSLSSAC